jgi:uncharacterized membrane protein HdeD (DUF308 family)
MFVFPITSSMAFAVIAGAVAVIYGLYAVIVSFNLRKDHADWWVVLVEGILGVVLGFIIVCWPLVAVLVTAICVACWMMIMGLITIFQAIELRKEIKGEGFYIISGILAFIVGILMLVMPLATAGMLIYVLAIFAVLYGILLFYTVYRINRAIKLRKE